MLPKVVLQRVSRDDVGRMARWLEDPEVQATWYGADSREQPIHIGYSPQVVMDASEEEWRRVFSDENRKIYSVYTDEHGHIGEGHLVLEPEVRSAHLVILIGRKDLWYKGYGSAAMINLLDEAFNIHGVHRVWLAVPEYNEPALHMCQHIGFVLEGRLRKRQLRGGQWYDSLSMGLLADEYARRRATLVPAEDRA